MVKSTTTDAAVLVISDALLMFEEITPDTWILDTRCSFHMTSRREWFTELRETGTGKVRMGNDTFSTVKGIGSIRILNDDGTTVLLTQVRYVPEMSKNLISLGTLENNGCWFKSRDGILKVIKGCTTVLKGEK